MNTHKYMLIVKGEIRTKDVNFCIYNEQTQKWDVTFNNGKTYSYAYDNIEKLGEPEILLPQMYRIRSNTRELFNIQAIYVFHGKQQNYWHICFENGSERDYTEDELKITRSCILDSNSANVFEYLKQVAALSNLKNDKGEKILKKQYGKIGFVGEDTVLATYLNPRKKAAGEKKKREVIPIFPFGCNKSQYTAVKNALENKISVIQGPPGTGKTQTILNIIANILISGKTVEIVSNNNSATENVFEKLASEKYNMGFLVAQLGKSDNKKEFIEAQSGVYPDFSSWKMEEENTVTLEEIRTLSQQLNEQFEMQERLALLKQEQEQLETELQYFHTYLEESSVALDSVKFRKNTSSDILMEVWQECQYYSEQEKKLSFLFKIKSVFVYGISNWKFYKQDMAKIITSLQGLFYKKRQEEIQSEIQNIEEKLSKRSAVSVDEMCNQSMRFLKHILAERYGIGKMRKFFTEEDLWKAPYDILKEYPIVLSTTFSSRSSLGQDVMYDYLIMDEASQVDVATGALALSCAKNAIIVGDTKQLPNVVTDDMKRQSDAVFDTFRIQEGYRFTKSFLQSVLDIIPKIPQTLLREHYRCHPKIINFCNQKFYNGELIIMTQDNGEKDVLSAIKTVQGNHARNHYSQRQIDVIKEEVLPDMSDSFAEIGIIAPYKNQVTALEREIKGIDVATVHKFQGKEKDTIIISTVDDEITDFADDPYLINVAVSRAKKKLCIIVSGNEQPADRNIGDLVSYIEYNNFEVKESRIYSVFDYLYKQYTKSRQQYLEKRKKISKFDSENLMYALLEDILKKDRFSVLDVVCHQPLNMLIRNPELLDDRECAFAMNPATHLDFLIYNKVSKKPVLAIEVDGQAYHKEGTVQAERDSMKNHILELYGIPIIRCKTNGSGEEEIITGKLSEMVS